MKYLLAITFLFLSITLNVSAQNITVSDFHLDEMDQTANIQGTTVLDQNGEKCALIKVITIQTGFTFDVGMLGVQKTIQKPGEIWVYVPAGVRKISVSHPQIGQLRDYQLPGTTQKAKTYIMDLKADTPLPVNSQKLIIKCVPENAVVMIDGEMADMNDGYCETTLKLGEHRFKAMSNQYYSQEGSIEIKADRPGKLTIELDPKKKTVEAAPHSPRPIIKPVSYPQDAVIITANGVSFEMIKVVGGTFTMGATSEQGNEADNDEKPTHQVTLRSYYIGKYEVTRELWRAVTGKDPTEFKGENLPVETVSWEDCQSFILELNRLTDKHFRLPTEAEWEFAARGGNNSKGYKYSGSDAINEVAQYDDNSDSKTHAVGTKSPNELGLYDMSGNVSEWCSDWYGPYNSGSQTNPTGALSGPNRVFRGGSWFSSARSCRSTTRFNYFPGYGTYYLGLRLVLSE